MAEFAHVLKQLRKEYGFTQKEVAEGLNVNPSTVARWEKGNNEPDIETLKRIARFFEVDVNELVGFHNGEIKRAVADDAVKLERKVLRALRTLPAEEVRLIEGYVDSCIEHAARK